MASLTTVFANEVLDASVGTAALTVVGPVQVRLMTANGTAATAGTEVTGGTYSPQTVTFAAAAAKATSNSGALTFTGMPAVTVVGVELWDATPTRLYFGALVTSKTTNAGDTFTVPVGDLDIVLS